MPDAQQPGGESGPSVIAPPTLAGRLAYRIRDEVIRFCRPGNRIASERVLAERLGTTRGAIRRAMAQLMQEGWLQRRRGSGYFVASPSRRLTNTTGLLLPVRAANLLSEPFFREVFMGLSEAAEEAGRFLLTLFGGAAVLSDTAESPFWSPKLRVVDSLVTFEVFNEAAIGQAALLYPVVCLDAQIGSANVSTINFDHAGSVKMAAKYLVDLGHKRIGFAGRVGPDADPAVAQRYAAYRESLQWASLPADQRAVLAAHGKCDPAELADRWRRLPADSRPTAIIVVDLFWPLVAAWVEAGVRIPRDLSLVQVGVVHDWAQHLYYAWHSTIPTPWRAVPTANVRPPFGNHPRELVLIQPTTVDLPAHQMGAMGMQEVVRRLSGRPSRPRHERLAPRMVVGNTTASA